MSDVWTTITGLALASFAIRISGILIGNRIPKSGRWARGLNALPGCLTISLVTTSLLNGGVQEWIAAIMATTVAITTNNLLLTMFAGILAIWALRI